MLSAAVAGALIARTASSTVSEGTLPWQMTTIMLLPLALAVTAFVNTNSFLPSNIKHLSRNEERRLTLLITEKRRQLVVSILFYILGGFFIAMGWLYTLKDPASYPILTPVAGGLIGLSIVSVVFVIGEIRGLGNFSTKLASRAESRARIFSALQKLRKKDQSE